MHGARQAQQDASAATALAAAAAPLQPRTWGLHSAPAATRARVLCREPQGVYILTMLPESGPAATPAPRFLASDTPPTSPNTAFPASCQARLYRDPQSTPSPTMPPYPPLPSRPRPSSAPRYTPHTRVAPIHASLPIATSVADRSRRLPIAARALTSSHVYHMPIALSLPHHPQGSRCYAKGAHHAECLPVGTCRERWPSASCDELAEVTTCAGFGGDCTSSGCCATAGQHCFMKDRYLSRCMHACVPTDELRGWSYAYAGELEHSRLTLESSNTLDSYSTTMI